MLENSFLNVMFLLKLTPSMAIYDTMQSLQSPIGTHSVGYAYNLAGFLLAAGEKGQRFAMPLSRVALESPARSCSWSGERAFKDQRLSFQGVG
ncbi:putative endopeptidase Clp [Helianthus annuus]|nr:putative endopeptidase Clp [Helianthus annuus]